MTGYSGGGSGSNSGDFLTNLPPKQKDNLENTISKLTTGNYETAYQFNVGEYDSTIAFFVV